MRWTIDLDGGSDTIRQTPLDDLIGEFPRVDPRIETRRHRHGWYGADTSNSGTAKLNAIAHIDLQTGRRRLYQLADGDGASEPVFVPRSADAAEGDGWLTAVVYRAAEDRSDLLVFDALEIDIGPIAVARMPRRMPFGFHGNWVDL